MDLEHLTKHQIVLLTLLVSFVTSIATGIVTVSLMNQAPPEISRTINQIVEHTVEKVVPAAAVGAAPTTVTEKTVVVKDDDLAAQSIAKVQKAIVRITAKGGDLLVARGVIIDGKGMALTDASALEASSAKEFDAILASGERVPLSIHTLATSSDIAVVDIAVGTSTGWSAVGVAQGSKLQLGQSVIRIGGTGQDTVGTGVIAALPSETHPSLIEASVSSATPGSVIITLFGEVIGIVTGGSSTLGTDHYSTPNLSTLMPPAPSPKKPPAS